MSSAGSSGESPAEDVRIEELVEKALMRHLPAVLAKLDPSRGESSMRATGSLSLRG